MADEEFAALLRELKDRSGLSYGVLGKRLHLSGSTLHRYVNGDAVPQDYAPVERFARICGATSEELVELHRRWVRADVLRGRRGTANPGPENRNSAAPSLESAPDVAPQPAAPEQPDPPADTPSADTPSADTPSAESQSAESPSADSPPADSPPADSPPGDTRSADTPSAPAPDPEDSPVPPPPLDAAAPKRRRRRTVAIAGAGAAAAAAVSVALIVNLLPGGDDSGARQSAGATSSLGTASAATSQSASGSDAAPPALTPPSSAPTSAPSSPPSASPRGTGSAPPQPGTAETLRDGAAPTVATNPYRWEGPCSQHYLVDRKPAEMPPPPTQQDARRWVAAVGAVSGGDQMLALTVQGAGAETVVLEALHVRVIGKDAPLAWNDYVMGVGCGGEVSTKSFDIDLDAGRPGTAPKSGQRDFPYKVSETDPEVFYVTAHSEGHDVSWYLELEWSSGDRRGSVRIDDNGKPFRTSANAGRPAYQYPNGASEWDKPLDEEG
ncbi:helix-turn-helix domain-containing protein [Yinghuangia sp. YIM S09857]|uniref:helix-turn-helix domain-containing protein n=1 Tax=Yinghuangia sp. YIM S09857 TaxID=3436929 RepID=UPI003F53B781